jgi:hypothetical protein
MTKDGKVDASRYCVFCGLPADSKEHVFALRLCERAGASKYPVIVGLAAEGKDNVARTEHPIDAFSVRQVCADCNNNWMNNLEAWFELRLGSLIERQWPESALKIIEELQLERHKLAQWLMKTAVMFSCASLQGEHPVEFVPEVTRKIKSGIVPENCWVDLAYSKSTKSRLGGGITRCFRVINGGAPVASQVLKNGDGFKFIIQYNHLLLCIGQVPSANITYLSHRGELPVRLYPTSDPIPNDFAYDDIMHYERSIELETWAGCRGNIA